MEKVFTEEYYRGEHYPEYFLTDHWHDIKDQFIYKRFGAHCWICEKTSTLLPHHERYDNLFHERLFRDIFILCYDCHNKLHFYKIFFVFTVRTPLTFFSLKRRRLLLRSKFLIQKKRFASAFWHIIRYITCV